jgi:hypothetical protein
MEIIPIEGKLSPNTHTHTHMRNILEISQVYPYPTSSRILQIYHMKEDKRIEVKYSQKKKRIRDH